MANNDPTFRWFAAMYFVVLATALGMFIAETLETPDPMCAETGYE